MDIVDGQPVRHPALFFHRLTEPPTHAGLPAVSMPCGFTREGLPVGLQIIGRPHADADVVAVAAAFVFLVGQHMAQYALTGKAADPMPARLSAWAVYDVFGTSDGEKVFVGVVSDTNWRAFCAAFDLRDLAEDESLATNGQRVAARDQLLPRLREIFAGINQAEATRLCEAARLPFAPIRRPEDLFDDPHLNEPGALTELTLEDGRTVRLPALPLEINGRRLPLRRDLPRVGEHTADIARELGYTDGELAAAEHTGALATDHAPELDPATIH